MWKDTFEIIDTVDGDVFIIAVNESGGCSGEAKQHAKGSRSNSRHGQSPWVADAAVVKWSPELLRFEPSSVDPDALIEAASARQMCFGIYGVLPLGRHCTLIFITERHVAGDLPGGHIVHEIKGLGTRLLPPPPVVSRSPVPAAAGPSGGAVDQPPRATPTSSANAPTLPSEVLAEYNQLIDMFCAGVKIGGLNFFVSFTADVTEAHARRPGWADDSAAPPQWHRPSTPPNNSSMTGHRTPSTQSYSGVDDSVDSTAPRLFQWNHALQAAFAHGASSFVAPIMRGAFTQLDLELEGAKPSASGSFRYALVTRLSCKNAGTRYNRRGLDAAGFAANSAETEVVVWTSHRVSSLVLLRGSVPVCWKQPADLTLKPLVTIDQEHSVEALRNHISLYEQLYNCSCVHGIDLLSAKNKIEAGLSAAYDSAVSALRAREPVTGASFSSAPPRGPSATVTYFHIDLGRLLRKHKSFDDLAANVRQSLKDRIEETGFSLWEIPDASAGSRACSSVPPILLRRQAGILRFNCLDCLDRTNAAQFVVAEDILALQIAAVTTRGIGSPTSAAEPSVQKAVVAMHPHFAGAWLNQGNVVSHCYTGNDALLHEFVGQRRLRTLRGMMRDARTAIARFVQQNFFDGTKQDAISLVTVAHDPAPLARVRNSNPFERHMRLLNFLVVAGLSVGSTMWILNLIMMYLGGRWHWEMVAAQLIWSIFLVVAIGFVRRDATSYTNYPLLN